MHKLHDIHYLDIGPVTTRDNGQIKCTIMNRAGREEILVKLVVVGKFVNERNHITNTNVMVLFL